MSDSYAIYSRVVADQDTLALAFELDSDLQQSDLLVGGVATSGCTSKRKWLCAQRLQPLPTEITCHAANSGSLDMLRLVVPSQRMLRSEDAILMPVAANRA